MPKLWSSAFLCSDFQKLLYLLFRINLMKIIYAVSVLFLVLSCDALPMTNPVYRPYPSASSSGSSTNENQEFTSLMQKDAKNKKRVTAEVLTYLLNDTDPKDLSTAAVIENTSNCNIILRLVGINSDEIYNLPIARHSKNQFVVKKGSYTLKSRICGANYYSQKNLSDPLILKLSN